MITTKLEAYLVAALLLLITVAGGAFYFYHKGKANELADVKLQSAAVLQKAQDHVAELNVSYSTAVKAITETKDGQIAKAADAHAADLARIGVLDSYRKAHPVLGCPASSGAPADTGGGSIEQLEQVAAGLADALRDARADLAAAYADRDALTGK